MSKRITGPTHLEAAHLSLKSSLESFEDDESQETFERANNAYKNVIIAAILDPVFKHVHSKDKLIEGSHRPIQ